jgi:hypothetical protein
MSGENKLSSIFFLGFPHHWNLRTFLGASIISSPVAGFLPRRLFFFFTQNLPKPVINTSSPDSKDRLMSSSSISTVSIDFLRVYPIFYATESNMLALVSVPAFGIVASFHERDFKLSVRD